MRVKITVVLRREQADVLEADNLGQMMLGLEFSIEVRKVLSAE